MNLRSITSSEIKNKKVVLRVDFNVSLKDGKIRDDTRIRETIPTIKHLLDNNNSLVILSHLGRPKGKVVSELSLKPIAERLQELLNLDVKFIDQFTNSETRFSDKLVLLENVRFDPGDEKNDPEYAKKLASYGEVYVNDAFAVCHRSHASTVGISSILPSFAGLLLTKEVAVLSKILENPNQPMVCVVSGAKISDKIGLIKKQLELAETVLVGGGIANTFLKAKGCEVGDSLVENEALEMAKNLLFEAASKHSALIFPSDFSVLRNDQLLTLKIDEIAKGDIIFDVGPESINRYSQFIEKAQTVVFNGPLGKYEDERFSQATKKLLKVTAESSAISVVGGGDTIACIENKEIAEGITHISTGGGAMLEFIEKGNLPGISILCIR